MLRCNIKLWLSGLRLKIKRIELLSDPIESHRPVDFLLLADSILRILFLLLLRLLWPDDSLLTQ